MKVHGEITGQPFVFRDVPHFRFLFISFQFAFDNIRNPKAIVPRAPRTAPRPHGGNGPHRAGVPPQGLWPLGARSWCCKRLRLDIIPETLCHGYEHGAVAVLSVGGCVKSRRRLCSSEFVESLTTWWEANCAGPGTRQRDRSMLYNQSGHGCRWGTDSLGIDFGYLPML